MPSDLVILYKHKVNGQIWEVRVKYWAIGDRNIYFYIESLRPVGLGSHGFQLSGLYSPDDFLDETIEIESIIRDNFSLLYPFAKISTGKHKFKDVL